MAKPKAAKVKASPADAALPAQLREPTQPAQQKRGMTAEMLRSAQLMIGQRIQQMRNDPRHNPFLPENLPKPPPGVLPRGVSHRRILAQDEQVIATNSWAVNNLTNQAMMSGIVFLGFPFLSELAQIAEYRAIAETTATEMTREWIELKSVSSGNKQTEKKIKELTEFMKTLDVQGVYRRAAELDQLFGRAHIYHDTGDTEDREELKTSIGNGRDKATKTKARKGMLEGLRCVEPVWCYPARYNSNDPLRNDWYKPQAWYALGKEVHVTRLVTLVGREVPDMLKPSFMFGGLPMSQMAQITVDNWLRTRKSVSDLVYRYSVNILKTAMDATTQEGGMEALVRAQFFSEFLNNNGVLMLDKDTEEFENVSTPLSGIESLQAQSQEHMSAVSRIPLVKLTGISPAGLNASSEGEIQVWYEWIKASQEKLFSKPLDGTVAFCMISLWGEVDPDIIWEFKALKALSEKEEAELRKTEADTDAVYAGTGAIGPEDIRRTLTNDPDSRYHGLGEADADEGQEGDLPGVEEMLAAGQKDRDLGGIFPRLVREAGRSPDERTEPRQAREPRSREGGARSREAGGRPARPARSFGEQ